MHKLDNSNQLIEIISSKAEDFSEYEIYFSLHQTQFGELLVASTRIGICFISFLSSGQEPLAALKDEFNQSVFRSGYNDLHQCIVNIFKDPKSHISPLKLHVIGSPFQLKVWKSLLEVPYGTTISYQDLAKKIGQPKASRAVGNAVAQNKIALLIPCHRVIKSDGMPGNYRWGKALKEKLLKWEKG